MLEGTSGSRIGETGGMTKHSGKNSKLNDIHDQLTPTQALKVTNFTLTHAYSNNHAYVDILYVYVTFRSTFIH